MIDRRIWLKLFRSALLVIFALVFALPPALCVSSPGMVMERENAFGREVLYASKDGIKVFYPNTGFGVISRAPSWNITFYSVKAHKRFEQTLNEYRIRSGLPGRYARHPKQNTPVILYAGVKARKIMLDEHYGQEYNAIPFVPRVDGTVPMQLLRSEILFSEPEEFPYLPIGAMMFLHCWYGVFDFDGIPMARMSIFANGKVKKQFYTKSCTRQPISASEFQPPANLVQVFKHDDIFVGAYNTDMEGMAKDLGLGEGFSK